MFFISKYIYKFLFWLYSLLHVNYVTLDKLPKFLGLTWIDFGLAMAFVISLILTLVFLFRFTMFKTTLVFGWLTICAFIVAVYNQNYNAEDFFGRFDTVEAVYPKKVYTKTNTEYEENSLKLVAPLSVKSIEDNSIEIYDNYKRDSNSYHIDKRRYVDESGKTVKVSEQNYDAFDEKCSEIIKETKLKTTAYYFNESLVHKNKPDKSTYYTLVFKLDKEQVDKAKKLEKQSDKNKKISENSEKFFNE